MDMQSTVHSSPDLARASALFRRYAHFEGDAPPPAPDAPPTETPPGTGGNGDAKFTQAELDKYAGEARKTAREKAVADLLKEMGVEKADELKSLIAKTRERDESEKTASQKLDDARLKAEKERDELKAQLDTERAQRVIDRRDSAIRSKAATAHDIDAVLEWANRPANAALLAKTVSAEGVVSEKAVDELITASQKAAAYLWKKGGVGSPSNSDGTVPRDVNKAAQERASRLSQSRIRG